MSDSIRHAQFSASLSTFGADIAKWPGDRASGAREALMRDPGFRDAWEKERVLDRAILSVRGELDGEIGRSGAIGRVREAALARVPLPSLDPAGWARIAAAVLVAGMLGGAMDLLLARQNREADVALVDPILYGLDLTEIR